MNEQARYIVCYDISNDRERYRVDKLLRGFGFRVQKSVWEVRLTRASRTQLIQQIEKIALATGGVAIYRVYAGTKDIKIGTLPINPDDSIAYVL
jgi:CRISPR-associated protein Cas2